MEETYLPSVRGGRWAISREVDGEWIALVQDGSLTDPSDAARALRAKGLPVTPRNLETYFPSLPFRGRRPTLEFLEIFSRVGNKIRKEVGV